MNSTAYIEKGVLAQNNPLVFNKEGMLFNQIKKEEVLLKDNSQVPWLVAYISKNASGDDIRINYNPADQNFIEVSAANISQWAYSGYDANNPFLGSPYNISYKTYFQSGEWAVYHWAGVTTITGSGAASTARANGTHNYALRTSWWSTQESMASGLRSAYATYSLSAFNSALSTDVGGHSQTQINDLLYYNNKVIKTQDGKYYQISVRQAPSNKSFEDVACTTGDLHTLMSNAVVISNAFTSGYTTPDNSSFKYSCTCPQYIVTYVERKNYVVTSDVSATRNKTVDSLYDIIAMPYGAMDIRYGAGTSEHFTTDSLVSMASMTSIATALGGGSDKSFIYDIQLLPYCPVQGLLEDEPGKITVVPANEHKEFDYVLDQSNSSKIGILFYVPKSSFTLNIEKEMTWDKYNYISGFTDITVLPPPYSSLQQNIDYVIPELVKPDELPYDEDGTAVCHIETSSNNAMTFMKIDKVTGKIKEQVTANELVIHFYQDGIAFGGAHMSVQIAAYGGHYTAPGFEWDKPEYEDADYYLAWRLDQNSWAGKYVNEGIANVSKIPVYSAELGGAMAIKIDNECNLYRLVSPNYVGEFEFSVSKNGGVSKFNVDCTYKPYNPYIHVNPDFKNLYGQDFNDSRGLICQGDYTVGMISDAFTNYELQNKNYQAIFNRQIQNMDVMNDIARQEAIFGAIGGTVASTASGAVTGAILGGGNPVGAVAGAAAGLAAGAVGGAMDLVNLDKKINENRSYAVDMYNFSLQNIKALPYSMTRCTALTYNNKLFPFVETYSCTDEEKEAFINKLKYDGMTVNKIGKIKDYTDLAGNMLKAEIIRFEGLKEDAHMASEIYSEIKKGVYL